MKRFLSMAVALTLSMATLAGCGSSAKTTSSAPASSKAAASKTASSSAKASGKTADNITIATNLDATTPDPTIVDDNDTVWKLEMVLQGLTMTSDDGTKIQPCLAEKWDVSADGLTYTFNIRKGLKFADGNAVTKEDWLWSFDRAMNAKEGYWIFACQNIDKVEAPDDNTLVIHLKAADAATLSKLSCFNMTVQEKAFYDKNGGYDNTFPMGTGSYYVKEWVRDDHMTFEANPNYWGTAPKTKTLKFTVVTDDDSRVMQLKSGDVDVITEVPFSAMSTVKSTDGLDAVGFDSTACKYLVLNTTDKVLSNEKVRKALLMATDKQQLVDMCLYGYGEPSTSYMPKSELYYNTDLKTVSYDVDAAKKLLAEAGYPNGFDIEFLVRSGNSLYEQIATIIKDQWAKIGVNVTLTTLETGSLLEKETAMKHQICIGSWSDDIADPSQLGGYLWNFDASQCFYTGYNNPDATALYKAAETELNDAKRGDYYKQLQQISYDAVHLVNLFTVKYAVAMKKSVTGFEKTPLGAYRLDNLVKTE